MSIDGNSTSVLPVLEVTIALSESAPIGGANFKLRLHGGDGEHWESTISVPVLEQQGSVVVHSAEVVSCLLYTSDAADE